MIGTVRESGIEECIDDLECEPFSYYTGAHREDVGVIMLACCLGTEAVSADSGTYLFMTVCRDRNTDPGSADKDASVGLPVDYRLAYRFGEIRVITACLSVCTVIFKLFNV